MKNNTKKILKHKLKKSRNSKSRNSKKIKNLKSKLKKLKSKLKKSKKTLKKLPIEKKNLLNSKMKKMLNFLYYNNEDDTTHYKDTNIIRRCMCIDYDIKKKDYNMENNQDYRRCKKQAIENTDFCKKHQNCMGFLKKFTNGFELDYKNKDEWEHPYVKGTHNCYSYFLNDIQDTLKDKCDKLCKKKHGPENCPRFIGKCGNYKPQPGDFELLMKESNLNNKKRNYTCKNMEQKILSDNKSIKPVSFNDKCPDNFYKGAMVVQDDRTFHFYRQNKDSSWSHKPGTMAVTNLDADKKQIYIPHFSNRDYSHKPNKIKYNSFCNYYCIPHNYHVKTNSI